MRIYFIRHGESTWDIDNLYGGLYNDHLSAKWVMQATQLAQDLSTTDIKMVYSSPLLRARKTATVLAGQLWVATEIVDDLRERNYYGILSGMNKDEANIHYPQLVGQLKNFSSNITWSEPYVDFVSRVRDCFELIKKQPYTTIAVITHGGWLRQFARDILQQGEISSLADCCYFTLDTKTMHIGGSQWITFG